MNRAEKRRQKKKAEKTGGNAEPGQATSPSPGQQTLTIQEAIDLAVQHHTAGRLPEAENIYQQILQADPNQPVALNLLGVIAYQAGKNDQAVKLITKALAIRPNFVEAQNNLGAALVELGRFDEAVAICRKALAIRPNYAEVHNNLGNALHGLGKLDEAMANFQKALVIKPDFVEPHTNLGHAFLELNRLEEAVASCRKALAIKPDNAEAHNNLGAALMAKENLEKAASCYQNALAIKPEYAEAHNNLGLALQGLGRPSEALSCHRRAVTLQPQNDKYWRSMAVSLEALSFTSVDDNLWQDLLQLLERPTVSPFGVIRPIISALRCHPSFSKILDLMGPGKPKNGISYGDLAEQLSKIPLFIRIMELGPINDLGVELMLTLLRRAMIEETVAEKVDEKGLQFSAALALQCFANEYVFFETDEETAAVEHLQQKIAALVEKESDVPPSLVAALGAYRSLNGFPWAQELCECEWEANIKDVIKRQITEPQEEQSLRPRIPRLTSIQDTISQSVREQYEESPYPRWIETAISDKISTIDVVLRGGSFFFDLGDYEPPECLEILVAGCGTGQHVIYTASRFSKARVFAVDLSLSSLSYAMRKTDELGFSNIEYAQADIMELGSLGRRFDLIECVGVLHHLGDPLAGWQILVDLLRPGGLMKIGLYSETARQGFIIGRALIAEKGYAASAEEIRRCRQEIIAQAEDGNSKMAKISDESDFFSLSNCRDLLFHVQEHRFTLPQIKAALETLELEFLGFELRDRATMRKFKKTHPKKWARTSLPLWHKFELKNPDTFRGMYQFWCKKK